MDANQKEFILKNHKRSSPRQLSKTLGISRKEIETFLGSFGKRRLQEREPLSLKKELLFCAIVLVTAVVARWIYLHALGATPFFEPMSSALKEKTDDALYDQMGLAISGGNWAGNFPLGTYRIPLYPYFLAVIYSLFGHHLAVVHTIQLVIGSLSAVLVYRISREVSNSGAAALAAGLIAAVYLPFIFFEHLLVGETLSIFFNLCSFWFLIRSIAQEKRRIVNLILSGSLLGASCLLRPNTLLTALALAVYLAIFLRSMAGGLKKAVLCSAVFLAAAGAVISPVLIRNITVYHDWVPISAIGGLNFYIGNNPEADGKFQMVKGVGTSLAEMVDNSKAIAERETGRVLKPSQVSSFWSNKALAFMASSPAASLGLLMKKAALFFNRYEFPDILDIYFAAQFIPALGTARWGYGLLAVLALTGLFWSARTSDPRVRLVQVFILSYAASVILFFITARYRLPAAPFLIIAASWMIGQIIGAFRDGSMTVLFKMAALGAPVFILVFWPVEQVDFATNYNSLAIVMKYRGDKAAAERYYRKAIEISPNYPSPYHNLAILLDETGRHGEAVTLDEKFQELK